MELLGWLCSGPLGRVDADTTQVSSLQCPAGHICGVLLLVAGLQFVALSLGSVCAGAAAVSGLGSLCAAMAVLQQL